MRKIILIAFIFPSLVFSQKNSNMLLFKDGKEVNIQPYLNKCIQTFKQTNINSNSKVLNSQLKYCECWIQNIAYNFNSKEYLSLGVQAQSFGNDVVEKADVMWQNKKVQEITSCIIWSAAKSYNYFSSFAFVWSILVSYTPYR